jgi:hypothetical protein
MRYSIPLILFAASFLRAEPPVSAEVVGSDIFAQTFDVKLHNGQIQTVPFSKWTEFVSSAKLAIDPTDIHIGDRVLVRLDSNEATALSIVVVARPKVPELASR